VRFNYSKFIIELSKYVWSFFNASFLIIYCVALIKKIAQPEFKNLSNEYFILIGTLLLVSIILNLLWVYKKALQKINERLFSKLNS